MPQNDVGIYASQISGHLWAPNGAMDALATVTVGSTSVATITFSGIPQGYKHLQLRVIARNSNTNSGNDDIAFTFNGDTAANYSRHRLYGTGSATGSSGVPDVNFAGTEIGVMPTSVQAANVFGVGIIDILDYSNTSKNKTVKILSGVDDNSNSTSSRVALSSSVWRSTAAINSINFYIVGAYNFLQYSQVALYGVK